MTERLLTSISTAQTASLFAVIRDNYLVGRDGVGECLHRTEKKVFEV
jgi:hypothetical protein